MLPILFCSFSVGLIAFLYSSVGHAGASGYIAVMTLFGLAPTIIRPTALVLNILVASIGTFQFWHAGHFSWKLFWPFALLSVPAAYVGGYLQPAASVLRILIGVVLLFSSARLVFRRSDPQETSPPSRPIAISVGGGLGFLSGLTGTGGEISLTPLLLFCQWAHIRQAAAVSALFIWVNSIAGLVGYFTKVHSVPSLSLILGAAAIIGGIVGSHLGSRRLAVRVISLFLATILLIAGMKLIFTRSPSCTYSRLAVSRRISASPSTAAQRRGYSSFNFGAVSGDQGLVL
ncbi:MAG: hypothetical protein C5B58_05745 [Acidobacteria bacterium]|nr:MAG: hypothetical protein C5B58_05745 [Acidobacteriota bacterium]